MILLRHGQSEFNVRFSQTKRDPGIHDPVLTELGHNQAAEAALALANEPIRRIIVSPYTRALQTARPLASRLRVPVIVNPQVRERFAFTCDIGTPISRLATSWPEHEFAGIDEIWWPEQEEPVAVAGARAARFRGEMAALTDWHETLVISHWGFILALTGQRLNNGEWLRYDPTAPAPPDGIFPVGGPYIQAAPDIQAEPDIQPAPAGRSGS
jgi:broad specificity phosphatase PhoE